MRSHRDTGIGVAEGGATLDVEQFALGFFYKLAIARALRCRHSQFLGGQRTVVAMLRVWKFGLGSVHAFVFELCNKGTTRHDIHIVV